MSGRKKKIMLLMWKAGGAHLSVCRSLQAHIVERRLPWDVVIVNAVKDICPELDPFYKYFKYSNEDLYNFLIRYRFYGMVKLQFAIGRYVIEKTAMNSLAKAKEYMMANKPDYVISAVHHFNGILAEALHGLKIPFGIIPTELMDLEKTPLWFAPQACRYADFFSLALEDMASQGIWMGCKDNCIVTGGLVVKPQLYEPAMKNMTRDESAVKIGIDRNRFTILIIMGGTGAKTIKDIVRRLDSVKETWQLIACCGNDEKTRKYLELHKRHFKNIVIPLGFTDDIEYYMKAAHLVITKPGPITIWEALVVNTPIIVDATDVIIWEQPQVDFIRRYELGKVVTNHRALVKAVMQLKENEHFELNVLRSRMAAFQHRNASESIIRHMQRSL